MRFPLRRLAVASVVSLFATATCVDSPTGPRSAGRATFSFTPVFSQSATKAKAMYAAVGLEMDHVRILITRPVAQVVKDTTVAYNGVGDLPLELNVIGPVGELLTVQLDYLAGAVVLYSGTAQVTTVSPLTNPADVPPVTMVIEAVGPGFDATSVTLTPASGSFPTNAAVQFTAKAFKGTPATEIIGAPFEWLVDDETVGTISATGSLTPTTKGGPIKVRATALSGAFTEATITLKNPPTALTLVSGGSQTANAGATLTQVVVKVADVNGNGVEGEAVTFAVASGGGSIVVNNGTTDASGLARATWTLGSTVGSQSITATRAGLTGSPLTVTATATGPTKLGFVAQPTNVASGAAITPPVQVAAQDASGNTVTGFTGTITIAIGTNPGSATLGGTLSASAVAGVASFSNLTLNNASAGYTLTAAATGLTNATSSAFNVTPAAAAALTLSSGGGQTAATGATLTQIAVKVADANGNGVAGEAVTFAVATGGGSIVVDNGTTDASGLARVTWTLGTTVGAQSITATRAGLTGSPLTITATATAGAASKLGFTVQPSSVVAGAAISPAVQVAAQDANGNTVTSFSGTITIAIGTNPGSATLGGTVSATATAGVATFSNLKLSTAGNGYTLTAASTGLTTGTSAAFNVTAGTPAALEFIVQPSNTIQNAQISPPVQVRVVNAFGATVTTATNIVTVAFGANPGSATLGGNPNAAAVAGIASFSTLTVNSVANGYTLTATATGLTSATSTAFNIVAPAVATRTWTGAFSTAWSDVANWSPGGTPTVSDSIVIPSGTSFSPTISANTSVRAIVVQSGAVLNVSAVQVTASPGTLTNQGSLNLTGSTLVGSLDNEGTTTAQGSVAVSGAITNDAGATLRVQGNTGPGAAALVAAVGIGNDGTIELTDIAGAFGATLSTSGTIANNPTGVITSLQGAGGQRVLSGALSNGGQITTVGSQTLSFAQTGTSTNSGSISVTGGNFTITQTGTAPSFTNTNTISIGSGRTMTINGGAATFTTGSVAGLSGTLSLQGVSVDMTTASVSVPLTTNAATTIVGGTLTIPAGQELILVSSTFSSAISLQGMLTARRTNSITGTLTNAAGSTLRAMGVSSVGALTIATGFTNNGTIQLTDSSGAFGASVNVTSGALNNVSGALIQSTQGAGGSRTIGAALTNAGTITVSGSQDLTITKAGAAHINSGTIGVTSGDLVVSQNSGGTFTNTGTVTVPSGRTFTISGGAASLGDNLVTGAGGVTLNGVDATFTPRTTFPVITSDQFTAFNGGTLTIAAGEQLTFVSSTIASSVSLSGTLTMRRTNTISGAFTNAAGSTLRAFGISSAGNLTIAAGFTNNGTIQLTDSTGAFGATLTVTSGTLTNPSGSFIQPLPGSGGSRTLAAELNNAGTITIGASQGMTLNKSGAAHTNSGAINLTTGDLTLTQAAGGTFTTTGTMTVPSGRTWTISGGTTTLGDNLVTGVGTVDFTGVAVSFTPKATFPVITSDATTTFNGGTLTIGAGEQLTFVSSTISSNVALSGTLTMRRTNSITGTFTNVASSTLRAFGISSAGNLTIANGFTNDGTIQLTDSTGAFGASLTITTGQLVNPIAGQIQPLAGAGGSRTLAAELFNNGTITIGASQGMTLNKSGAAHTNGGTISIATGDLTITQGAGGSFTNTGAITVPTARTLTITGGTATLGNNLVTGVGSIDLTGVALSFTPRNSFPVITSDATTSFNGGTLAIGSGEQLTFVSSTISSNVSLSGTLTMRRTNSITGTFSNASASTLRAFGISSAGNLTIANGFTNNGTIQLTDSTGAFGATLTVTTGTLTNPAGSFIQPLPGAGGSRTLAAQLSNAGTITIGASQGMTINKSGAAHANSGTISVSTGDLTITQAAGGSFTTTGPITVPTARTLTITGGSATLGNGFVTGAGSVTLTGVATSFEPRTLFPVLTSDATTVFNGGTLVIPDTVQLTFVNSTISSNVTLNGMLTMRRTNSITGTLTKGTNSTLRAFGISSAGNLTIANGFTNNGAIHLTDSTGAFGATLTVTTGTLTNPSAGTIQPLAGAGGSRTLAAQLSNAGTITIGASQGMTINKSGAVHSSSGFFNLSTGDLTVTQAAGGSFTTTGPISVPVNRTLTFTGGSATLGNGWVTGAGSVVLTGVATSFEPRTMFPVITSDAATAFNGGALVIPDTVELTFVNSTISSNVTLNGMLTMRRTNSITGALTKGSNSTLRAFGISSAGNLTIANGFTNNGAIHLTDSTGAFGATLAVTTGTLTNPALGSIQPLAGSGGARTLAAQLSNAGTITIGASQGMTINKSGAVHTSSGTFNLSSGDLTVTQAAGGSFTTTGAMTVPTGRTLTFSGGSATLGNNLVSGVGGVTLTGVALSFTPRTSFPVITSDAATSFNGGTLSIASTEQLTFVSSTISSNVSLGGTLTMRRTNSITGTFSNASTANLRAMGISSAGALTIANGFINNGTIQLTDSTGAFGSSLTVTTGTLTNAVGATLTPLAGSGGSRTLTMAVLDNQGSLTVPSGVPLTIAAELANSATFSMAGNATVLLNKSGATHVNSGTISMPAITSGTLNIGATSVTQTFSNAGTLTVGSGRTIGLLGNTTFINNVGGTYAASGTLNVASTSTFTNTGTLAPGGVSAVGTLTYIGIWNPGSGGTLSFEQNTTFADQISITTNGAHTIGGTLTATWLQPTNTTTFTLMAITGTRSGSFSSVTMASGCTVGATNPNYTTNCVGAFFP